MPHETGVPFSHLFGYDKGKKKGEKSVILTINATNTHMNIGLFQSGELLQHWRLTSEERRTEDEYGLQILQLFHHANYNISEVEGVIISSVVPPLTDTLILMCEHYLHQHPIIVGPGVKTGLNIRYDNPREVGTDRIVNAVAAMQQYPAPVIIVALGETATTFCYVDEKKQYLGGAISPGIGVSVDALFHEASKLPKIEIKKPARIIGTNTIHALQSGIYYGCASQVDGIVRYMIKETNSNPSVIATGRMAHLVSQVSETIQKVDPYLTLKGLYYIYTKNNNEKRKEGNKRK